MHSTAEEKLEVLRGATMIGTEQENFLNLEPLVCNASETALLQINLFLLCLVYSCGRDVRTSTQNTDQPYPHISRHQSMYV